MNTIAALIIASGKTAENQAFDPWQEVAGQVALEHLIATFKAANIGRICIIADQYDPRYQQYEKEALIIPNQKEEAQMLDSIKLGLLHLEGLYRAVFITPVNIPLFNGITLKAMLNCPEAIVNPSYQGKKGHPLLLREELFPFVLAHSGKDGLNTALKQHPAAIVDVDDPGIHINLRKITTIDEALDDTFKPKLRPLAKLQIANRLPFYGPGTALLMDLIAEHGSVSLASKAMGISYSKAWKMINNLEDEVGFRLIERQKGGQKGGRALINAQGLAFIEKYRLFNRDCQKEIERIFKRYFK